MCSRRLSGQPTTAGLGSKCHEISTHFVVLRRHCVTRIPMEKVIEQISLGFKGLQAYIARLSAIEIPSDDFYTFDETADLFSVWLRNVASIREECGTFEHCLKDNSELKDALNELLVDVKIDLAEGGRDYCSTELVMM